MPETSVQWRQRQEPKASLDPRPAWITGDPVLQTTDRQTDRQTDTRTHAHTHTHTHTHTHSGEGVREEKKQREGGRENE